MRVITMVAGGILFLTGTYCVFRPGVTFFSMAFIMAAVMLFAGISMIVTYFENRKNEKTTGWDLVQGIVTFLLGLIILSNQIATDLVLPYVFGGWVLFMGVMRIVAAMMLKKQEVKGWGWPFAMGVLSILMSVLCFARPIIAGLTMAWIMGFVFIMQGINVFSFGYHMPKKDKKESISPDTE